MTAGGLSPYPEKEVRGGPELATVLVYTVVFAVLAAIGLGVYALVALISQM